MAMKRRLLAQLRLEIRGPRAPLAIRWSSDGPVVYVLVSPEDVDRTVELEDGVLADYDKAGDLVGFEIVGASRPRDVEIPPKRERRKVRSERWELAETTA